MRNLAITVRFKKYERLHFATAIPRILEAICGMYFYWFIAIHNVWMYEDTLSDSEI